jgi:uncharacterized protein DUF5683
VTPRVGPLQKTSVIARVVPLRWRFAALSAGVLAASMTAPIVASVAAPGVCALQAQERPVVVSATQPDLLPPLSVSPGGAFWRALVLPGWGHAAIGSYTRGAFYFGAQSATVYTLLRVRVRIGEAQDRVRFRENVLLAQLASEGITDPDLIQERLDGDEGLSGLNALLDTRKGQQEDMIAFGLFLLLISSADAYVSAHLARFPDPLDVEVAPSAAGGVDLSLRVSLPR